MSSHPASPTPPRRPTVTDWLEGARLRTLPAAAAPVLIGAGAAAQLQQFSAGKSFLALLVALLLQVGVNFANDYSDGIRGTDEQRVGPTRLTASGLVTSKHVLRIALACFAAAAVLGLILVIWSQSWILLLIGGLAIVAAWYYTGGNKPYGYMGVGLSELFVFIFFGLVATVGTTWVQTHSSPSWLWLAASGMGLISVALLMVNNIRDIPTDTVVGKMTIAVRLGDRASRLLYVCCLAGAILLGAVGVGTAIGGPWMALWLAVALGAFALATALPVVLGASGKGLLRTLRNTGFFALTYGVLVGLLLTV